jgi:serine protein kinase|tara:strand:- start:3978 stop:5906 length:1929 start_codon:yes stop_codon:yes gene_type:complete
MPAKKALNSKSLIEQLTKHVEESSSSTWEGTLRDYVDMVVNNKGLHMSAHCRMLKMIESHGVERDEDGDIISYNFFSDDLFGINEPIDEIMSYLRAAAKGSEVSRRILLLYGPTSSGKSQLAILLKRGLEDFSKTDDGAIYALSESPMFEDPLSSIPNELRQKFNDDYGIKISGQLSPYMEYVLSDKYDGNFLDLPVKRVLFSEKRRVGIGTFVPSDKKSQDISELVGSMDLSKIGEYGSESDPRAYKFDGELNIANRGMMEFVEMLKVDQKFLYVLLTLAQEKNIKTGRFPLIYADEFLLAHTNETEYRRFLAKEEMEALHDRIIVAKVPYNLSVSDEVKIYDKLIHQSNFDGVHIAPYTLYCAAMFAVLSRLKTSKNEKLSLMNKMRLYDGDEIEGFTSADVPSLKSEFDSEGMDGISPRYVINRISSSLSNENATSITPIDIIRSIRSGFSSNPKLGEKEIERLENILTKVIEEYSKIAKNEVQKAFFVNFEEEIQNLLSNYMDHVGAYLDGTKVEDEWGDMHSPNERLMRSIEEKINITESGKNSFRQEIYRKMLRSSKGSGEQYNYKEHPKLREALEKELFEERQDVIRLTVSSRNPEEDTLKRINVVIETLCDKYGYTAESANKLLRYVSSLMARN